VIDVRDRSRGHDSNAKDTHRQFQNQNHRTRPTKG
jgi:hypothetical protein